MTSTLARSTSVVRLALTVWLAGCSIEPVPGMDPRPDASILVDAATWEPPDAEVAADAGGEGAPLDPDAGVAQDAATPVDAGPVEGPTTVEAAYRVLHWNIAGGKENDCATRGITDAVLRYVRNRELDFVGLNEVCPAQYDAIRDALRTHWGLPASRRFSAYVGDETPRVVGNAIFSRFGLDDVTRLRVGEDRYGNRNLLCGAVPARAHLRFCSVHLTPGDATARRQLSRVLARIERWWENRGDTVILTGDLNLLPDDVRLNEVYSAAANHPRNNPDNHGRYRELDDADADHCPGYGERSLPGTSRGPCASGAKIDFIFVRQNRIVDGDYSADTLDIPRTCTGACSDHRAVGGRVRVRVRVD